jgi:hypothetical protein
MEYDDVLDCCGFFSLSFCGLRRGILKYILGVLTVLWCTRSCTSLMATLVPHAEEHRSLVTYPCGLIYTAFSLLVIF